MTYKNFLNGIRQEMEILKKQEIQELDNLNTSGLTEYEIKMKRKEIIETFFVNMENLKKRDGYEEAINSSRLEGFLRGKLINSAYKVMKLKKELKKAQSEDDANNIKDKLEKEQGNIKDLTELYKQAKLEFGDDKPGTFIDVEINRPGSLLERRKININGVDIEYIISTTKRGRGLVDDCKVLDSYKINDVDVIKEFVDKVIFSYPDLINSRRTIHKEGEKRTEEISKSFKLEWLAHNFAYLVLMFGNTEKDMIDPKKNCRLYKNLCFLRESARHADLDDEKIWKQKLYNIAGLIYICLLKK